VLDRYEALSHWDEVDAQFLALVCADEDLLRAEFDAIIAAGWGRARHYRPRQSAGAPALPMRNETPSAGRAGRTARRWNPDAGARARQRSPPPRSAGVSLIACLPLHGWRRRDEDGRRTAAHLG
jgi:hypothetical protein